MKKRVRKDYNRRLLYKLLETENLIEKALQNNRIIPLSIRKKTSPYNHVTKIRNICRVTGRTRGVIRKLGISNLQFRVMADEGKLPG